MQEDRSTRSTKIPVSKDPQTQIQVAGIIAIRDTVEVEVGRMDIVGGPNPGKNPIFLCDGIVYDTTHTYHRVNFLVDEEWMWKFRDKRLPGQQLNVVRIEKWRIL